MSTRALLVAWGAAAAAATGVALVAAGALGTLGPGWALTLLATYAAGVWAVRAEPRNRAALALLAYGCAALTWMGASVVLLTAVQRGVTGTAYVLATPAVQAAGLVFVALQAAALVRYPDGAALLRAERWTVVALLATAVALPPLLLLTVPAVVPAWIIGFSGQSDGLAVPVVASPWFVPALAGAGPALAGLHEALLAVAPLLGVAVAAARYRYLDDAARHRMAWPLQAALLLVLGLGVNALAEAGAFPRIAGDVVLLACQVLLPVSMAIGIAAPGLFDALGAARRTVSFAALAVLILAGYVAAAGLLGATVGGDDLRVAVVVAVLAAVALEPLRRTLVRRAGRLAFGGGVSRDDLLQRLGDTLERTMDRTALPRSVAETAREGLGVEWVRLDVDGSPAAEVGRAVRPGERPVVTVPLRHGSEDLGAISCGPTTDGRPATRSRTQLDTLARQVAMALANARLADELGARLREVDESRARLVRAEDTARRRLERDLHDGAQQDLAALLARIALARRQLGREDLDRLAGTLDALHVAAGEAMRNLRELVSGLHETALADQGLVAAVEGRAAALPIPAEVVCGPGLRDGRLAPTVESTAYFTVCEALANTLKHGDARRVTIALALDAGRLRVEVADDGRGFEPARTNGAATGLTGLRDRLAAVGGTLDVESRPGSGTTLTAVVPAGT